MEGSSPNDRRKRLIFSRRWRAGSASSAPARCTACTASLGLQVGAASVARLSKDVVWPLRRSASTVSALPTDPAGKWETHPSTDSRRAEFAFEGECSTARAELVDGLFARRATALTNGVSLAPIAPTATIDSAIATLLQACFTCAARSELAQKQVVRVGATVRAHAPCATASMTERSDARDIGQSRTVDRPGSRVIVRAKSAAPDPRNGETGGGRRFSRAARCGGRSFADRAC